MIVKRRHRRGRPLVFWMLLATASIGACRHPHSSRTRPPNLLLVTVDTVRADHVGAYGDRSAETPNLDRLAREGVRFDQADSAAPLTLPSHATILSGLLPPHHGLRNNGAGRFPADRETLGTRLSAAGYRTGAFVGAFVLDHRYGLARGFDVYDDEIPRDPDSPATLEAERPGSAVVDRALSWLDRGEEDRPFFAWVHLYDAHAPYLPPEPFRSRHAGSPYDGEVASVDHQVGRLLDWLDRRGLASSTVVAVAADHGEGLGEHGERTHGFFLYEATLRVPLLLRAPERIASGRVVRAAVGLVDLAPTLAGLLRIPPLPGDGRDLSAALTSKSEPVPADYYAETRYPTLFGWSPISALRRERVKLIEAPREELFDLSADAGETNNLLAPGARRADLESRIATFQKGSREIAPLHKTDAEAAAKLANLGYLTGAGPAAPVGAALRDPKDALPLFLEFESAHMDEMAGRLPEAGRRLLVLTAREPQNSVFADAAARIFRKMGDAGQAIRLYRRAIFANPSDLDARYDLSVALEEAGRATEARHEIEEAIRRDPAHPAMHNALGVVLSSEGKVSEALAEFERAVALDSRDPQAQNNRGNALRAAGRMPEAEDAYRAAIAASPAYSDAWNGLGTVLTQTGRAAQAVTCFDRALAISPRFREAMLNRAIAFEAAGDAERAAEGYREFLAGSAGDPALARSRAAARALLARLQARGARK
jgi:choline-sulfatase